MHEGDILVVKHKIVSKAEGPRVALDSVKPSRKRAAVRHAEITPMRAWSNWRMREAKRVVRDKHVLITETQHGFVCANSGVDVSNVDGGKTAVLLPERSRRVGARIHRELKKRTGLHIPVIIADSFGRAWREGLCDVAIGVAGMRAIHDYRGKRDAYGYTMHATEEAVADELACVAGWFAAKDSRVPACIIRGYAYRRGSGRRATVGASGRAGICFGKRLVFVAEFTDGQRAECTTWSWCKAEHAASTDLLER